jgi:hypothetical protein
VSVGKKRNHYSAYSCFKVLIVLELQVQGAGIINREKLLLYPSGNNNNKSTSREGIKSP